MIVQMVRMTLVQLGVNTQGLDIVVSGGTVHLRGEIRKLKPSAFDSEKGQRRLLENISERLRHNKQIKRVLFT